MTPRCICPHGWASTPDPRCPKCFPERRHAVVTLVAAGLMTVNQARAALGLAPRGVRRTTCDIATIHRKPDGTRW